LVAGHESKVPAPLVRFRVNFDPEYRLVGHKHLDHVIVIRAGCLECYPLVGNPDDPVHVVRLAIDGEDFEDGHIAADLLAEPIDRSWEDLLEERLIEWNARRDRNWRA